MYDEGVEVVIRANQSWMQRMLSPSL